MLHGVSSTLYDDAVEHQRGDGSRWYPWAMRRWSALILLLLTALLPLQPLIASAQTKASLPACCRRTGAHQCMLMRGIVQADSGTQTTVRPAACPLWRIPVTPAVVAVAAAPFLFSSKPAFSEDIVAIAPTMLFMGFGRSRSARAPPAEAFSMPFFQA